MILLISQVFVGSVVLFDHESFDAFNVCCVLGHSVWHCLVKVAMLDSSTVHFLGN